MAIDAPEGEVTGPLFAHGHNVSQQEPHSLKLMDQVRRAIRVRHYSRRTEEAYAGWVRRYIAFRGMRHPAALGPEHIASFLSALATESHVSASTQNQALGAVLFLYRIVLGRDVGAIDGVVRARAPKRLPVVLTRNEVSAVLDRLRGASHLIVSLLYGGGLRLREALERGGRRHSERGDPQASVVSFVPPFVRDTSPGGWLRHSHRARSIWRSNRCRIRTDIR